MESAVRDGVARVHLEGYDAKRIREIRQSQPVQASTGQSDGSGLRALGRKMQEWGMGSAIHVSVSTDGPLAQIAATRQMDGDSQ